MVGVAAGFQVRRPAIGFWYGIHGIENAIPDVCLKSLRMRAGIWRPQRPMIWLLKSLLMSLAFHDELVIIPCQLNFLVCRCSEGAFMGKAMTTSQVNNGCRPAPPKSPEAQEVLKFSRHQAEVWECRLMAGPGRLCRPTVEPGQV